MENPGKKPPPPEQNFNFFLKVHKSILSPDFYNAVGSFSPGGIGAFFLQMCLITALISGSANTFYALDAEKGLPAQVSRVFPGMSIQRGVLVPGRPVPFVPPHSYISTMLNTFFCMPGIFDVLPDSFLVVDTSKNTNAISASTQILFTLNHVALIKKSSNPFIISYSKLLSDSDTLDFSIQGVNKFLVRNRIGVWMYFCVQSGMVAVGLFFMSIGFLSFAAYIFRADKPTNFGVFFAKACFAVSPVFVGTNVLALSGTQFANAWYVTLVLSAVVMFRGVVAGRPDLNNRIKGTQ